jgi:hypothetical protein
MDKLCLQSYIKTRLLLGLTATQIYDELTTAYGQGVASYRTVAWWIERFSNEQQSLEDNPRSGRPITVITQQNIDAVKDLANDDPHISIDYIVIILGTVITQTIVMATWRYWLKIYIWKKHHQQKIA